MANVQLKKVIVTVIRQFQRDFHSLNTKFYTESTFDREILNCQHMQDIYVVEYRKFELNQK